MISVMIIAMHASQYAQEWGESILVLYLIHSGPISSFSGEILYSIKNVNLNMNFNGNLELEWEFEWESEQEFFQ